MHAHGGVGIVDTTVTPAERLIIMLLLTSSPRVGSVAQLRWAPPGPARPPGCACQHMLRGGAAVARHTTAPDHVFPTPGCIRRGSKRPWEPAASHASVQWVRSVCCGVFARILGLLRKPHAHLHTFRHTMVHMLYVNNVPFDTIAKWLGHQDARITGVPVVPPELAPPTAQVPCHHAIHLHHRAVGPNPPPPREEACAIACGHKRRSAQKAQEENGSSVA